MYSRIAQTLKFSLSHPSFKKLQIPPWELILFTQYAFLFLRKLIHSVTRLNMLHNHCITWCKSSLDLKTPKNPSSPEIVYSNFFPVGNPAMLQTLLYVCKWINANLSISEVVRLPEKCLTETNKKIKSRRKGWGVPTPSFLCLWVNLYS